MQEEGANTQDTPSERKQRLAACSPEMMAEGGGNAIVISAK